MMIPDIVTGKLATLCNVVYTHNSTAQRTYRT